MEDIALFKKILVALDGSEPSHNTLSYASEIADRFNAELYLLSVIPPISTIISSVNLNNVLYSDENRFSVTDIYEKLLKNASKIVKEYQPDLKVTEILREGHVPSTIVNVADSVKADLIIMGSRGLSGIKNTFLGGVSKYVAEHCKQPILIIK